MSDNKLYREISVDYDSPFKDVGPNYIYTFVHLITTHISVPSYCQGHKTFDRRA